MFVKYTNQAILHREAQILRCFLVSLHDSFTKWLAWASK